MSASPPSGGGFSLFPSTNTSQPKPAPSLPPRKTTTPRPRAATPSSPKRSIDAGPAEDPHNGRSTPQSLPSSPPRHRRHPSSDMLGRAASVRSTGNRSPQEGPREDLQHQEFVASGPVIPLASNNPWRPQTPPQAHPVQQPHALGDVPARTETAFSEAPTLVRSQSAKSRSSIAKRPIVEPEDDGPQSPLRSIFPQYNYALPLDRQEYFPTQRSPTHIPHGIISRQPYSPTGMDGGRSPPALRSPEHHRHASAEASNSAAAAAASSSSAGPSNYTHQHSHSEPAFQPPRRRLFTEPEPDPPISGTDELRGLWKVSNGWKASPSEGRPYVLRVATERDAPVYTLSSATGQPFYNLRIEPNSASAYVTLARHDPSKPYKAPKAPKSSSGGLMSPLSPRSPASSTASGSGSASSPINSPIVKTTTKHWTEALTTTLEEPDRRLPPNDGLVALLYPLQAARMALEKPNDEVIVATAEREAARLVYDHDSDSTFLVHPALATPFRVTIERHPALSRTEYILEHVESPHALARLVRDGIGGGFLEVDTGVASRVDAVYVCDVAVTALLLMASEDEKGRKIEMFEPPPPPAALIREGRSSSRISMASRSSKRAEKKAAAAIGTRQFESFEVDVESQASSLGKQLGLDDKDKMPRSVRIIVKILTALFKCIVWVLTIGFKTLAALIRGLSRCCGEKEK